jgi:hypothetical protein
MASLGEEKERVLHKRLVKVLQHRCSLDECLFFHVKNDIGASRGRCFYDPRPLGVLAGVADFCILRRGKTFFLEIKSNKGRLSNEQKKFLVEVNRLGHCGLVGFGWDDIMDKLNKAIFSDDPRTAPASMYHSKPGSVIWVDEKGLSLKRRPQKGISIFLC